MILAIKNLTFGWQNQPLFQNINCQMEAGEVILLKGENGCGKTTLLQIIAGMIPHFSRGRLLSGEVLIQKRSIIKNPPKTFFPQIGFIPSKNFDLFLLNENLEEEITLIKAVLSLEHAAIKLQIQNFETFFPEIQPLWSKKFSSMEAYEKIIALAAVYYLQNAQLYLLDEILKIVPEPSFNQWLEFFKYQQQQGKGILFISHNHNHFKFPVWEIKDKTLVQV